MSSYSRQNNRGSALVITLVVVVAVLALLGAIGYVLISKKDSGASTGIGSIFHKTVTASTPDDIKSLLTDAKAGKFDAKCTYTTNEEKSVDSTIYVSGATKMRVDTPINDKPGHLLRLGDSAYLWADGNDKGSKLPMKNDSEDSKYTPDEFSSKAEEYRMKCQSVDSLGDSLFTLPSDVTFTDFTTEMKSYSSSGN